MKLFTPLAVLAALTFVGCNADVPPGFLGQIRTVGGFTGEILQPGKHQCYGRDQMWLVEGRDRTFRVPLNVLLEKDQVNFGCDIQVTLTLKKDTKTVVPLFNKVVPDAEKKIPLQKVFDTYGKRILNSVPRQFIRQRTVEQILSSVTSLENEIESAVTTDLSSSPLQVIGLSLTNFDFPDFITQAQEKAKQREIEIKEAEAQARIEIVQLENEKKKEALRYDVEMIEAKKISDANRLIGASLQGDAGDRYLRWHEIKVYGEAAKGPNNTILLPMQLLENKGSGNVISETPLRRQVDNAFDTRPAIDGDRTRTTNR